MQNATAPAPLDGDAAFTLEVNQTMNRSRCEEFCPDLVIAKGTGALFGLAGPVAFESKLDGGLDCQTGEFRANVLEGVYGIPTQVDPNDTSSKLMVLEPATGTFHGTLSGRHSSGPPESIEGKWALEEPTTTVSCTGPFMVTQQP